MKKSFKNLLTSIFSITMVLFSMLAPTATAEELVISGNGSGSTSQINSSTTLDTNINQANNLDATNKVDTNSNTGDNSASDNTGGDVAISTGDVNTSTSVTNTGNVSEANVGVCDCPITNKAIISENNAGTVNTISNTNTYNTNVSVNQVANIANNITTNANTGNNTANNNIGDVFITTGNINAKINVLNGPLNISKVRISQGTDINWILQIAGNGVSSINAINNVEINNINVSSSNIANIINNIKSELNTGKNTANNNNGDVAIDTGDVWSEIKVTNLTNINKVVIDCGCKPKPGENPPPILPPGVTTTPPSPSVGGGGPGGPSQPAAAGEVAAAISGMLPVTGTNWLVLALFGNILMLFLGAYLRLRSGRSPGITLA